MKERQDERFKPLAEKNGENLAANIIRLWNCYDIYYRRFEFTHPDQVHRACVECHALWVGANLDRPEKANLFVHYSDLESDVQIYDMVELINCWRRLKRKMPPAFQEYCHQKGWDYQQMLDS